jgi:hypothetical protein
MFLRLVGAFPCQKSRVDYAARRPRSRRRRLAVRALASPAINRA